MRFPRSRRLKTWGEFGAVRRSGKSQASRNLVLGVLKDEEATQFRFGFVTSKKVGNAVKRNLVRRRLRAVVRTLGPDLQGGGSIVTIARFRAAEASYEELLKEWRFLARKAEILLPEELMNVEKDK